jgi:DNA-binding transcriptional regulator YhcF (GntR family)
MQEFNGFIKLHRKLTQWGWYQDDVVKGLFIHCLLMASFKEFNWMGRSLNAGQFITSRKHLAEDLGFTEMQIRTAIKKLESTQEITTETTNRFTVITVNSWEYYQSNENEINQDINQQITNKQPHLKNVKNDKNVKKYNTRTREGSYSNGYAGVKNLADD